jgi:hypothetical protein
MVVVPAVIASTRADRGDLRVLGVAGLRRRGGSMAVMMLMVFHNALSCQCAFRLPTLNNERGFPALRLVVVSSKLMLNGHVGHR